MHNIEQNFHSVKLHKCFQKDTYDCLIRFFLLCSYSDLYMYNLDQLPYIVAGHTMVNCIINLYLFYLDAIPDLYLHRRLSSGSVIAAGLATSIGSTNSIEPEGTAAGQANDFISDMEIVVMIGTLVLITLAFIEGFFYNSLEENEKYLELEAILFIALIGVFFYNSFSGSSPELESEEEQFYIVGKLVGQLINRSEIDEETGEKILFAKILGCYDGWRWRLTPLIVRCKVSDNYKYEWISDKDKWPVWPLFSYDVVYLEYDQKEPYFLRYYYIVSVDHYYGSDEL